MKKAPKPNIASLQLVYPWSLAAILFISLFLTNNALAEKTPSEKLTEVGHKGGAGLVSYIYKEIKIRNNNEKIDYKTIAGQMEFVKNSYDSKLNGIELSNTLLSGVKTVNEVALGVAMAPIIAATGGVAAIPILLGGAALNGGADMGLSLIKEKQEESVRAFLSTDIDQTLTNAGLTLDTMRALPPNELRSTLEKVEGPLKTLRSAMAARGNLDAYEISSAATIDVLQKTDKVLLDNIAQQGADIGAAKQQIINQGVEIKRFTDRTSRAFEKQNQLVNSLSKEIGKTQEALGRLSNSQNQTMLQTGAIAEVMFGKFSPKEKLASIDSPLLNHLTKDQKDDIKAVLETEVKKEEILDTASWIANNANNIGTIAKNLGIKDERISTAVNYANVANAALSQIMSGGNYLGAIASVTGLLGNQVDPAAERHKQLMDFIGKGFSEINQKLDNLDIKIDEVLRNQEKLFNGIVKLSEQMENYNQNLNRRLDRMEFEQQVTRSGVVDLLWKDYKPCNTAYNYRNGSLSEKFPYDLAKGGQDAFLSYGHMLVVKKNVHDEMIQCAKALKEIWPSIKNKNTFENILLLKFSKEAHEQYEGEFSLPKDNEQYKAKDLQRYLREIYAPTYQIGTKYAAKATGTYAKFLTGLSIPALNVDAIRKKVSILSGSKHSTCGDDRVIQGRIYEYLCARDEIYATLLSNLKDSEAEKRALSILEEAISPDRVHEIVQWTNYVAPYYDVVTDSGELLSPSRLINLEQETPHPKGRDLVYGALGVLDFSISQYSMLYGDLTAYGLVEGLFWDSNTKTFSNEASGKNIDELKLAYKLVGDNPYLARNILMLELYQATESSGIKDSINYRMALDYMASQWEKGRPDQAQELLKIQFGDKWTFSYDATTKIISAVIQSAPLAINLRIPMPSVSDFKEGAFVYPSRMHTLLADRSKMAVRYADYVVFNEIDDPKVLTGIFSLLSDKTKN